MSGTLHLPNRVSGPPGGWCYVIPETGQKFESLSINDLNRQVSAHYRANQMNPPADLDSRLEAFVCARAPGYCAEENAHPNLSPSKLATVAFNMAVHGTRRLLGMEHLVPQEQAESRAQVCVGCPENVPVAGCSNCHLKELQDIVSKIRGKRTTSKDAYLQTCRVCLCDNKSSVLMPIERLKKMMTQAEMGALPDFCWKKIEATYG